MGGSLEQGHIHVDVFHELMVRLYSVFVIHALATQKCFKVDRFGRNMEKGSPFFRPVLQYFSQKQ